MLLLIETKDVGKNTIDSLPYIPGFHPTYLASKMTGSKNNNQQQILKAGLWAAVSSLPQAKLVSLDDQLRLGREHAARHGCKVVAEFVVPGESRDIVLFEEAARRMDAYRQLGDAIEKKSIDVLIYLDRSRLGRQSALSMAVVGLCAKAGILTYDMESPPATLEHLRANQGSIDGMLLGAIKSVTAQGEIEKIKYRHASGMRGRAERGFFAGAAIFGYIIRYETIGGKPSPIYDVNPEAAALVQEIFRMYLQGNGFQSISDLMTERGALSPSGRSVWTPIMVTAIIDKVWKYAGFAEYNRRSATGRPYIKAPGNWTPLIDEATANAIIAERKSRAANRKLVGTPWMLSGVCYCTTCGFPMQITRQRPGSGDRHYDSLRCYRHRPGEYIPYRRAMEFVLAAMAALADIDLSQLEQRPSNAGRLNRQAAAIAKQLEEIEAATLRADDQYVAGRMTPERYDRQIRQLSERRQALEADAAALEAERQNTASKAEQRRRLQTAKEVGLEMLNNPDVPIPAKNIFLRQIMIVWIEDNQVKQIDWRL